MLILVAPCWLIPPYLAYVTSPSCLFLSRWCHKDNCVGWAVLWFHHNLEIKMVYVLPRSFYLIIEERGEGWEVHITSRVSWEKRRRKQEEIAFEVVSIAVGVKGISMMHKRSLRLQIFSHLERLLLSSTVEVGNLHRFRRHKSSSLYLEGHIRFHNPHC